MRVTNHHGRGTGKHAGRDFDVGKSPHIDASKIKKNICWTWDSRKANRGRKDIAQSEMRYYNETFGAALDAQNARHKARRQYGRIRTMDDIYHDRQKQPEESLLYIGNKDNLGDVTIEALWECVKEYVRWEMKFSKSHGNFYKPLSLALHADEDGQLHVHERGVYQYLDDSGDWQIGQSAALEQAGIPLPDAGKARSKHNNRKISWDAARRETWLDIVESHGYQIEREPEVARPHLGLEAWQSLQDEIARIDMERQQMTAEADSIRQALDERERELDAREEALEAREAAVKVKEGILTDIGRKSYQEALKRQKQAEERGRLADAEFDSVLQNERSRKREGKHPPADRQL